MSDQQEARRAVMAEANNIIYDAVDKVCKLPGVSMDDVASILIRCARENGA